MKKPSTNIVIIDLNTETQLSCVSARNNTSINSELHTETINVLVNILYVGQVVFFLFLFLST